MFWLPSVIDREKQLFQTNQASWNNFSAVSIRILTTYWKLYKNDADYVSAAHIFSIKMINYQFHRYDLKGRYTGFFPHTTYMRVTKYVIKLYYSDDNIRMECIQLRTSILYKACNSL